MIRALEGHLVFIVIVGVPLFLVYSWVKAVKDRRACR